MNNKIAFPGLGIEFYINRVAFTIFGKEIYWYGIIIGVAILVGLSITIRLAKRSGLNPDNMIDLVLIATPIAIICARIYYVIFKWAQYDGDFMKMIAIWDGGVAIYGAVIGGMLTVLIFCLVKKLDMKKVLDITAVGLIIGQSIGRWGNFVNQEAYGTSTDLAWRMELSRTGGAISVHPTFLYESLWNFVGFLLLFKVFKLKKRKDGDVFWLYVMWYGLGRAFIEGLRTDSLYLGNMRISQALAVVSVIVGVTAIVVSRLKNRPNEI